MALLTVDWTGVVPQVEAVTRPQIIARFLEQTGLGVTGTCTGGSTTTVVDAIYANTIGDDRWPLGAYIRMTGGTANNIGVIRPITAPLTLASGTFTTSAFPAAVQSGDTYEIWRTRVHPSAIIRELDRILVQSDIKNPCTTFLSEVPDSDMEQLLTNAWAGVNANLAKLDWAVGSEGVSGKRALTVATTSANGYATSQRGYGVSPGSLLHVGAQFTPADPSVANTGFLQLWDVQNSALIDEITTTSKATVRLWKAMSVPANCGLVNIRMGSEESGVTGVWDEVGVLDAQALDLPLPWWVRGWEQILKVSRWIPLSGGSGMNEYDPTPTGEEVGGCTPLPDGFGSGQQRLLSPVNSWSPMYVTGLRDETAFTSDTEAKRIDVAWVASVLAMKAQMMILGTLQGNVADRKPVMDQVKYWEEDANIHARRVATHGRQMRQKTVWVRM